MPEIFIIEEYAVTLLLIAIFVGILARRLRMPYTVGLVVVGVVLAILFKESQIDVGSDLILGIFVPPIVLEAAFHLPINDLRRNMTPILVLAIAGVLITTFLVGGIVAWGTGMQIQYAIVFGSIVAATDPVAVIALFKSLGVPKRLQVLLEGESLLNDGTAIVIFNIAVAAAVTSSFSLRDGIAEFIISAGVGISIGLVLGILASLVILRINDYSIETAVTFILAYGAFVLAESVHVSGVLAVVAAGLVNGNIGPRGMSPTTRIVVFNFWEFMSFIANSFVFLLIGLVADATLITNNWQYILWGILAALVSRLIVAYGLMLPFKSISNSWKHVIYWGGLRGAISLSLVLGISNTLEGGVGKQLLAMVFGLVLFTMLVQGTSMDFIIKKLKVVIPRQGRDEYDYVRALASSTRTSFVSLEKVQKQGMMSRHVWDVINNAVDPYTKKLTKDLRDMVKKYPQAEAEELDAAWREFLHRQRIVIGELLADKSINEEVYSELVGRIDNALQLPEISWDDIQDLENIFQKNTEEVES